MLADDIAEFLFETIGRRDDVDDWQRFFSVGKAQIVAVEIY